MTSTVITPTAQTVADFLSNISGLTVTITGYLWQRQSFDAPLPVGEVALPTIGRTASGERESQIGTDDWDLTFPVGIYFDLDELVKAQNQAAEVVEKFILAVDANPSLSDPTIVDDASVVEAEPVQLLETPRPLLAYMCRLELTKQVPTTP